MGGGRILSLKMWGLAWWHTPVNLNYLRGGDWEDHGLRPAQAKEVSARPYLNKQTRFVICNPNNMEDIDRTICSLRLRNLI
jgi:hypothetical protein